MQFAKYKNPLLSVLVLANNNTAAKYVFKNNVANLYGEFKSYGVDHLHALEHLILGDGGLGLNRNNAAVVSLCGGGNGSHGVGALIFRVSRAALTNISAYREDVLAFKLNGELATSGANDTG